MAGLMAAAGVTCAAGAAAVQGAPEAPRTPPFVLTALALELTVDYARPSVDGTTALTIVNRGDRPETAVPLLLNRLMAIRSVTAQDGRELEWQSTVSVFEDSPFRQAVAARVTLPSPLAPGARTTLRVRHSGPLVGYTETGSLYIKDRIDPAFTILRVDALAFPSIGVLSDRANYAMARDDFRFDARVTVPASQVVATGGVLVERTTADGTATYHFAGEAVPFLNIAIAPYSQTDAGGVRVYALPDDSARAGQVLQAAQRALDRLGAWYGPLPVRPQLAIIEIPDGFGSQASATAGVILDAAAFRDAAALPQLYHEISHFWNPRDLDAAPPRWNEGLATYLQYRLARELDGFTATAERIERARARVCAGGEARTALERTPFASYGAEGMTDASYRVGFLMFSALEELLGQASLDAALRDYIQGRMASGGTTADFVKTMSRGREAALKGFFRDWMETSAWLGPVCSAPSLSDAIGRWKQGASTR
jgi:hypothetical protein